MRKAYLLFTLLMIGLASCKPNRNDKPTTYAVSNVHDFSLIQGQQYSYDINLSYLGPVQENVELEITGLPAGISADFDKPAGIPSFTSRITVRNNSADPGVYPCELHTTGSQTGKKTYKFNINVVTEPLCGTLGNYTYNSAVCDPALFAGQGLGDETITSASVPVAGAINPVRFGNFGNYAGLIVNANINCATSKIEIPIQSVGGGMEISGTGSFTASGMAISYTIYIPGVGGLPPTSQSCNFTMTKR